MWPRAALLLPPPEVVARGVSAAPQPSSSMASCPRDLETCGGQRVVCGGGRLGLLPAFSASLPCLTALPWDRETRGGRVDRVVGRCREQLAPPGGGYVDTSPRRCARGPSRQRWTVGARGATRGRVGGGTEFRKRPAVGREDERRGRLEGRGDVDTAHGGHSGGHSGVGSEGGASSRRVALIVLCAILGAAISVLS